MTPWEAWNFFVPRLFAKGKLSVAACGTATGGDHTLFRHVIRFLSGAYPTQPEIVIVPTIETDRECAVHADWLATKLDWGDEADAHVFDHMEWRFAVGWRNRYPKGEIPVLGTEPVDVDTLLIKQRATWRVKNSPPWFSSGIKRQAANVALGGHPQGRDLNADASLTCGQCAHMVRGSGGGCACGGHGRYIKCNLDKASWTGSTGSDIRKKWRACVDFTPRGNP